MKIEDVGLKFKNALSPLKRVEKIIVHHPAHKTWDIHDIHKAHQAKGWNGIGYNYFVTKDGRVQKGRGHHEGAHCKGMSMNDKSLGVSFQGDFEEETPTNVQLRAGAQLIAKLLLDSGLNIHDVKGHKDFDKTKCPGKNFSVNVLRTYILEYMNPKIDPAPKQQVKSVVVNKPSEGGNTVVKKGDRGKIVKTVQKLIGSTADGVFGPNTEARVKAFQKREGLSQDGIVGAKSWEALTGDKGGLLY